MNTPMPTRDVKPILWGATLIIGFVSLILVLLRVDTFMKNQAINDCGQISKFEQTLDNNVKVTYPVQDIYNACLRKKGL